MGSQQDIRWLQRFSNFRKALDKLRQAAEIIAKKMEIYFPLFCRFETAMIKISTK